MTFIAELKGLFCRLVCLGVAIAGAAPISVKATPPPNVAVPPVIQANYDNARHFYEADPDNDQAAWQFAHACFDRAEYSRDAAERASLANLGIDACRRVVARKPDLAAGQYYLAMNLAQLARTKLLGALPLLTSMEAGWKTAIVLDEKLDYGGPDRYVGLLYRDAPGWPISLGDSVKARKHLRRAVEINPNYPENYLNLIETYFGWNEPAAAAKAMEKLRPLLPAARREFVGDYWAESWKDWDERLEKIEKRLRTHPAK